MDIDHAHRIAKEAGDPTKYDEAIKEAEEYAACREKNGLNTPKETDTPVDVPLPDPASPGTGKASPSEPPVSKGTDMTLEIYLGKGVGNLKFGMGVNQILRTLGQEKDRTVRDDVTELYFDNYLNLAFRDGTLFQIGATRYSSGITYKNIDIFSAEPLSVLKMIEADAGGAFEMYGFIVFLPLGLSLTGFHDGDLENKATTVAVLEEWQSVRDELKPISFLA